MADNLMKITCLDGDKEIEVDLPVEFEQMFKATNFGGNGIPTKKVYEYWLTQVKLIKEGKLNYSSCQLSEKLRSAIYEYLITKPSLAKMISDDFDFKLVSDKPEEVKELTVGTLIDAIFKLEESPEQYPTDDDKKKYLETNLINRNALVYINHYLASQPRKEVKELLKMMKDASNYGYQQYNVELPVENNPQ